MKGFQTARLTMQVMNTGQQQIFLLSKIPSAMHASSQQIVQPILAIHKNNGQQVVETHSKKHEY